MASITGNPVPPSMEALPLTRMLEENGSPPPKKRKLPTSFQPVVEATGIGRKRARSEALGEEEQELDGLCRKYQKITEEAKKLDLEKDRLKELILPMLLLKKTETDHFTISLIEQTRFKTSLEEARELGCTVERESIDTQALKQLHEMGTEVPGATESRYFRLRQK